MNTHRIACAVLALAAVAPLGAQPRTFATGLLNPAKIVLGPSGSLLVTEFDVKPNTGRVSIVSSGGARRTLIDALPSAMSSEGPDGPTGLYLDDNNTLYVAIGEGDQLQNATDPGTQIPNSKGPSSPILASILQINFSTAVDRINAGFTLKADDQSSLADGISVTLDNGAGDKATVSVLASFRFRADPITIYRNTHPYALAKFAGDPNHLYMADAGLNALIQVDLPGGRWRRLTSFPVLPNHSPIGPPVAEAVPDSVRSFGDRLLVTLLSGFPFAAGNSKVMAVDPATGKADVVFDNLTSAIDIAWRARFFGALEVYVLEFSGNILSNDPGQLKLFLGGSSTPTVIADHLPGPSSMVLDPNAARLYIATKSGSILQLDLQR